MSNQDPVEIIILTSDRRSQRSGFNVAIVWFSDFIEQVLNKAWLFILFKELRAKEDVESQRRMAPSSMIPVRTL